MELDLCSDSVIPGHSRIGSTTCVPMYCEKDITINRYGRLIIKG